MEYPFPEDPKHILRGIVDETGKQVVDPRPSRSKISILADKTAFITIEYSELMNVGAFYGNQYRYSTETTHIDLTVDKPLRDGVLMILGNEFELLPNGNF